MKKIISLMLFFILSFTSIPFTSALSIANCNLNCFSAGTPVQTTSGFKPIEEIRIGDFVLTKDELTGYNQVVELFQRQANETYQITVKGITITTTEEHPFWIPGRGWIEARHLKVGDLLQNPEGKLYPIDRIEIKNDSTTVYNFRVEGVHNYFVTELEIWTHNCGAGGIRNIPARAPSGGGGSSVKTPYSKIPDSKSVGPGKNFTKTQKQKIIEENKNKNGGVIKSDYSGKELVPAQKSQKGVTPPSNEVQIDHIYPKSKGGSNSYSNAQVLSREENRKKSNK
ncbi:Hint domain-containing protein [Paenibacillus melissococcoides]|uniref:Hint domain-containing protein n=1 Tax=Paenibacillus melissococcoides TaxID=2912268 RepID=A0ABM9G062_9BACL|nr:MULTISPECIES: polymorphic toxin-type HINT domain-containing protein [Paenibacillus]MEB9894035.1 polymorphic toxin-type HINT domain-containing protein [Bacillus cereus]CAH8244960.1 Hint domain-containing protein [Paenibacillus melissococcoides]CAH8709489.1 Hint domain-containing protein [Paenibacillus melissococcoides]CAH8710216.1 Hint domain-containing protein [Paenibacillus melissococcoides]GIO82189.1 hypothetical protein J6TS7_57990 [Paenibacillus dendritiformis]